MHNGAPPNKKAKHEVSHIGNDEIKVEIKEELPDDYENVQAQPVQALNEDITLKFETAEYTISSIPDPSRLLQSRLNPSLDTEITEAKIKEIELENDELMKELILIKNENQSLLQEQKNLKEMMSLKKI